LHFASPHLFTIKTDKQQEALDKLIKSCNAQKITARAFPKEAVLQGRRFMLLMHIKGERD